MSAFNIGIVCKVEKNGRYKLNAEYLNCLLSCGVQYTILPYLTDKAKIKKHFHPVSGLRGDTGSGSIAVFFDSAFPVPSGESELKKIQINLKIKEWKGDL